MSGEAPLRGTLLVADRIVTLGHARTDAHAVVVRGSRIVWVGQDPAAAPPHATRVDLDGCVIGPGFVDANVHLTATGLALTGLDLSGAHSRAEVLRSIEVHAAQHTGRVVWGHGLDLVGLVAGVPSPDELAAAAQGRAVHLTQVDGHASVVDRDTLAAAPLARAQGIDRDAHGRPTGMLRREANHIVRRWTVGAMREDELDTARSAAVHRAAELGITSVHEMGGADGMGVDDFDGWLDGDWPIEVVPYWGGFDLDLPLSRDLRRAGGDVLLDGSIGAHTAALGAPYHDLPGSAGELELDEDSLTDWLLAGSQAGIQLAVHAIGDAALRQLVTCLRRVDEHLARAGQPDTLRRLRHRVEHAVVVPPDLIDAMADLGIVVSAQPAFEPRFGGADGMYASRLGPERLNWTHPLRALADHGVGLAFGSDSPVTPMDPWGTVQAAESADRGRHAVTRLEAVSMSTLGGRFAARQERYVGVVRAGMRADLAVFEGDPYTAVDPRGTRCVMTLVHGRVAHGEAPLPPAPGR